MTNGIYDILTNIINSRIIKMVYDVDVNLILLLWRFHKWIKNSSTLIKFLSKSAIRDVNEPACQSEQTVGASLFLDYLHVPSVQFHSLQNPAERRLSGGDDPGRETGRDRHKQQHQETRQGRRCRPRHDGWSSQWSGNLLASRVLGKGLKLALKYHCVLISEISLFRR